MARRWRAPAPPQTPTYASKSTRWLLVGAKGVILDGLMALCRHRAVLIITQDVTDTSTSVARDRLPLFCDLKQGHEGPHQDLARQESWAGLAGRQSTILRHAAESVVPAAASDASELEPSSPATSGLSEKP